MTHHSDIFSQTKPVLTLLASLPDKEGWAGMYGGVSNGILFCMGGTNFPDKRPWEGGRKKWSDAIYMLQDGKVWVEIKEKLPSPLAYGVSVSYGEDIIIIGGSRENQYSEKVMAYKWEENSMQTLNYPDLPVPLAYMAGTLVDHLIIVYGGSSGPAGKGLSVCYALDLENITGGWFELPSCPGRERILPVCAAHNNRFYLFSGETVSINADNKQFRHILNDAFRLTPHYSDGQWSGSWEELALMPRGVSAAGSPVPVMENGTIVFWGGVDAHTALYKDPISHPGIPKEILFYHPETDLWENGGEIKDTVARVTLPIVHWNNQWVYIGGETKSGFRTNTVCSIKL